MLIKKEHIKDALSILRENGMDIENDLISFLEEVVGIKSDYADLANITGSVATVIINDSELKRHLENSDISGIQKNIDILKGEIDTDIFEEHAEEYISEVISESHSMFRSENKDDYNEDDRSDNNYYNDYN